MRKIDKVLLVLALILSMTTPIVLAARAAAETTHPPVVMTAYHPDR